MNNVIYLPNGKTEMHHHPGYKLNDDVIDYIWDHGLSRMTPEQGKLSKKRVETADQILKHLPADKQHLLATYDDLFLTETQAIVEAAIRYVIEHESQIKAAMTGYI